MIGGSRWPALAAWLGTFLLFVAIAHGNFESTDAGFTMHAARALWLRGDSALLTAEQGGDLIGEQLGAADIANHQRHELAGTGPRRNGKLGTNGRAYVWFPMGHVFLLVPFVALGDVLTHAFPQVDATFRQRVAPYVPSYVEGTPVLMQSLVAMTLPAACLATVLLLLYRIARELGATGRDAALTALAIGFATQAFALGREQLSDGPGLVLLLAALLPVVRLHRGRGGGGAAVAAGALSGAAVLVRYQSAFAVVAFAAVIARAARRARRQQPLLGFVLGGAPFGIVLLLVDHARFGDAFDTGYPRVSDWFDQPPFAGVAKMLFGAGRGAMWLSPLLWLALPLAAQGRRPVALRWLAWVLFVTPIALFMTARGWQAGQCWAVRYITPGIVGLLAIVLPQTAPWRTWPRTFWALFACGAFAAVTSVVAPVRGVQQLAAQAIAAAAARTPGESAPDAADVAGWQLRYSPLLANWRYLWRSRTGAWEDDRGQPRDGSERTIEPLFGVVAATPEQAWAPRRWEDRCGRHLWWRFWADLLAIPGWPLVLPVLFAGAWLALRGWRRLLA